MNFCATKFISLVAFEQLNTPTPQPGFRSIAACRLDAARSRASSQVAACRPPFERTIGSVSRTSPFLIERAPSERPFSPIVGRSSRRWRGGDRARRGPPWRADSDPDPLRMRVHVEPVVADEPDKRHAEPFGRINGERRGRPDRADHRDAGATGLLNDLEPDPTGHL